MASRQPEILCNICGQTFAPESIISAALVRDPVADLIRQACPAWTEESHVCMGDLNRFRGDYVEQTLKEERGELSHLEQQVVASLREHELLAQDLNEEYDRQITFGERLADKVASFGGSWSFILIFGALLTSWIVLNTLPIMFRSFDPFPFIFLNLILSCLAAIQAPVIMMSQNRQQAKDRLRSEHDFRVNLKAELEIRHLHSKLDLLLTHQWQRLLEIQQLQTDLLKEIAAGRNGVGHAPHNAPAGGRS